MRTYKIIFIVVVFLSIAFSCEDTEVIEDLEIELVTMDEELNERKSFSADEDVFFKLKATNYTDEPIDLTDLDFCPIVQDKNFLVVHSNDNENPEVGRALPNELECSLINTQYVIPANESIYLAGGNWFSNPDNSRLSPGKYFSRYRVHIQGYIFDTYVEFSITEVEN